MAVFFRVKNDTNPSWYSADHVVAFAALPDDPNKTRVCFSNGADIVLAVRSAQLLNVLIGKPWTVGIHDLEWTDQYAKGGQV